ncbi:hypothetical protein DPMN_067936 [Dreissena polymorpha]|uniref:Uncharacterized protein n=1 Tax=Dreissena polymorpha TaxID=45954 RepID=A0A9D4BTU0_DREPO|nr:hypothetical protein DPMN_067936 [Dreissena polymorpha]
MEIQEGNQNMLWSSQMSSVWSNSSTMRKNSEIPNLQLRVGETIRHRYTYTAVQSKMNIHKLYKASCQEAGVRFVDKSSFQSIWSVCIPHKEVASPRDDVCATCEKLRKKIWIRYRKRTN